MMALYVCRCFFITRKRHANYNLNRIEWLSIQYIKESFICLPFLYYFINSYDWCENLVPSFLTTWIQKQNQYWLSYAHFSLKYCFFPSFVQYVDCISLHWWYVLGLVFIQLRTHLIYFVSHCSLMTGLPKWLETEQKVF